MTTPVRVELPAHLRTLAGTGFEVRVDVDGLVSVGSVLDAIETKYPMLAGTMRDHSTRRRRPFVRFFACGKDLSLQPADSALPDDVASGKEPLLVIGAIAGG